jgi:site-specific recombinase XerD
MEIAQAVDDFLRYCAVERRLSENTLRAYARDLADFRAWLTTSTPSGDVSTETLKVYLHVMVADRRLAPATVRRRMACMRAFFRRRADLGMAQNPFSGWRLALPRRKTLPKALSRAEAASLLSGSVRTERGVDAAAIYLAVAVRLMIATGIRVGELCKLCPEDISSDAASLRILGKGSRERIVYIADLAFRAELKELVERRQWDGGSAAPLFVNRHGLKLKPQSIRTKLRRVAKIAGLNRRVTPHMLRHTAATLLIDSGVDIRIVQRLLGHSSIATTEIYTHVSDLTLQTTLERANILHSLTLQ